MGKRRNNFIVALLGLVLTSAVRAQDDDVIKVDSSVVRLNVGVVDQRGTPITNLSRESFAVYENGVRQKVVRFEPTAAPFSVVMLLDMSGSTLGFRETIRQSAYRFIDALGPDDRVAVVEFYDKVNLLNDFTTKRESIGNSIRAANGRGKTQLYRAIETALDRLKNETGRRKAVIVLTDGVDTPARESDRSVIDKSTGGASVTTLDAESNSALSRVLSKADNLGATVFSVALPTGDPSKLADPTPTQVALYDVARRRLQLISDRTGGRLDPINRLEEMGRIYAEVAASVRALYTIEYQSSDEKRDGKWRKISIEVDNPQLVVKTKPGYFAK